MQQTRELADAVSAWEEAAQRLVGVALDIAPLTEREFTSAAELGAVEPDSAERTALALTQAADAVFEQIREPLAAGDDEAFGAMYAFLTANMSAADALMTAADSPQAIVASLRIEGIEAIGGVPADSWRRDIADAVQALRGQEPVRGAQQDPQAELNKTLNLLMALSGYDTAAIGRDAVLAVALPHVGNALTEVLAGRAASDLAAIQAGLHVGWAAFKRAATTVVNWVVSHVRNVVPPWVQQMIKTTAVKVKDYLVNNAGHEVGRIAAEILGLESTRRTWQQATPAAREAAALELARATDGEMSLLRNVTRVRTFIDRYGRWLISMLAKIPQVIIAVAALAAAAMILVLGVLWHGLRSVRDLVPHT
jgi:hypothetical protein